MMRKLGQQVLMGTIGSGLFLVLGFANPSQAVQHQPILAHSQSAKESVESMPDSMPGDMTEKPVQSDAPFRQIEQPLSLKLAVAAGAVALIGLELWWFLGQSRRKDA